MTQRQNEPTHAPPARAHPARDARPPSAPARSAERPARATLAWRAPWRPSARCWSSRGEQHDARDLLRRRRATSAPARRAAAPPRATANWLPGLLSPAPTSIEAAPDGPRGDAVAVASEPDDAATARSDEVVAAAHDASRVGGAHAGVRRRRGRPRRPRGPGGAVVRLRPVGPGCRRAASDADADADADAGRRVAPSPRGRTRGWPRDGGAAGGPRRRAVPAPRRWPTCSASSARSPATAAGPAHGGSTPKTADHGGTASGKL